MYKTTESKNPKNAKTKNGRIMLFPKCSVSNGKKIEKFIKQLETTRLLSSLGMAMSLFQIRLVGLFLF